MVRYLLGTTRAVSLILFLFLLHVIPEPIHMHKSATPTHSPRARVAPGGNLLRVESTHGRPTRPGPRRTHGSGGSICGDKIADRFVNCVERGGSAGCIVLRRRSTAGCGVVKGVSSFFGSVTLTASLSLSMSGLALAISGLVVRHEAGPSASKAALTRLKSEREREGEVRFLDRRMRPALVLVSWLLSTFLGAVVTAGRSSGVGSAFGNMRPALGRITLGRIMSLEILTTLLRCSRNIG